MAERRRRGAELTHSSQYFLKFLDQTIMSILQWHVHPYRLRNPLHCLAFLLPRRQRVPPLLPSRPEPSLPRPSSSSSSQAATSPRSHSRLPSPPSSPVCCLPAAFACSGNVHCGTAVHIAPSHASMPSLRRMGRGGEGSKSKSRPHPEMFSEVLRYMFVSRHKG